MVTADVDDLYNRLLDILRVHDNYLSGKGNRFARASAEFEVRGTEHAFAELHRQLERYTAAYELLQDDLLKWEADLDALCEKMGELEVKPPKVDDTDDLLDWLDRAAALYQPRFRP
jgi:hypothetical protein